MDLRGFREVRSIGLCHILDLGVREKRGTDSWAALPTGIKGGTEFWVRTSRFDVCEGNSVDICRQLDI